MKTDVETIATALGRTGGSPQSARGRDYRSRQTLFGLPLVHVAWGIDPATGRPRIAKGIVAVGPVAYGVTAVGFSAWGLLPCGLVAGGFWPVGLFAVGFWAVGLAAAGYQVVGLLAMAFWHAVGLVAAAPSPVGLERIAVGKGMAGLLFVLSAVVAWLMDRLMRAIGSTAARPVGMTKGKGLQGAPRMARASAARSYWFWLLAAVPVLMVLAIVLVRSSPNLRKSFVPPKKVGEFEAIPNELENNFPSLGHRGAPPGDVRVLRTFCPPDQPISGELILTDDNAWVVSCTTTQTFRLCELPHPEVEQCTLTYRARLKTEGLVGRAYLEMCCQVPGWGEFFSRGLNDTLSGSTDWATCQTPFFLEAGQKPDLIRLNLVVEGQGKVFIKVRSIDGNAPALTNAQLRQAS